MKKKAQYEGNNKRSITVPSDDSWSQFNNRPLKSETKPKKTTKKEVTGQHVCTSGAWNVKFLLADWSRRWPDRWQKLWGEDSLCVFSHNALKLSCDFSQSLRQQLLRQAVGRHTRNKHQLYSGYWHINLYLGPDSSSAEVKQPPQAARLLKQKLKASILISSLKGKSLLIINVPLLEVHQPGNLFPSPSLKSLNTLWSFGYCMSLMDPAFPKLLLFDMFMFRSWTSESIHLILTDLSSLKELSPSSSHNSQGIIFRFIRIVVKVELYK